MSIPKGLTSNLLPDCAQEIFFFCACLPRAEDDMRLYLYLRSSSFLWLVFLMLIISLSVMTPQQSLATDFSDDFDDNIKNKGLWGPDIVDGIGQLKEKNQRLEYVISSPFQGDFILHPLYGGIGPYDADWETRIDLYNSSNPANKKYNSYGISIIRCGMPKNELYAELYANGGNTNKNIPFSKGFYTALIADRLFKGDADTLDLAGPNPLAGSIRITYSGIAKVFTVFYDDGNGEVPLGLFNINGGNGGINGTGNWGMDETNAFCIGVYGYSENMTISSGNVYGDNFSATSVTADRVILLQPNGGDIVTSGNPSYMIEWIAPPEATSFKLQLSVDNGVTWSLIQNPVLGPTSYNWTVIPPTKNKTQCLVKVTAFNGTAKVGADKSDSPFAIEVLRLNSPNGGEQLTSNSTHTITWTTNGTSVPVNHIVLSYTPNNGQTWKTIDTSGDPLDDGSFDWPVPQVNGIKGKCKVKIMLKDDSGKTVGKDLSDETFTISP